MVKAERPEAGGQHNPGLPDNGSRPNHDPSLLGENFRVQPVQSGRRSGRAGGKGNQRRRKLNGLSVTARLAWRHQTPDVAALMTLCSIGQLPDDPPNESDNNEQINEHQIFQNPSVSVYSPTILLGQVKNTTETYTSLREDNIFSTPDTIKQNPFKRGAEISHLPPEEILETVATLRQVRLLLGAKNFIDVFGNPKTGVKILSENKVQLEQRRQEAIANLAARYGLEGSIAQIESIITDYGKISNKIITELLKNELSEEESGLEMNNDISSCNDPVELILITLNNEYDPRLRFEAKRKLNLMHLVGEVNLRERLYGFSDQQTALDEFLTNWVYSQEERKGTLEDVYFLGTPDPETGEYSVELLDPIKNEVDPQNKTYKDTDTSETIIVDENQKLLKIPRRTFTHKGRKIPIYSKNPRKELERKVLKMVRKGKGNPTEAIDDDVRAMGVFDSYSDLRDFVSCLQEKAYEAGGIFTFGKIEDTVETGIRTDTTGATKNGGDPNIRWVKFHGTLALPGKKPVVAEWQLYTNSHWMDAMYKPYRASEEFNTRRFFGDDDEIGAADLLFPYKFYKVDMKLAREAKLTLVRSNLKRFASGLRQAEAA